MVMIYFKELIFLLFLLSPFLYKFLKFPTILIPLYLILIYLISNLRLLKINNTVKQLFILVLFYNISLLLVSLSNINLPEIQNGSFIIPNYISIKQIFSGLLYNNSLFIFLLLFYFFIRDPKTYNSLEKIIYYFSGVDLVVSFIELLDPKLHYFLMLHSGYRNINFSFIPHPVSIVLNSYYNSFFVTFFASWSLYYWLKLNSKIYLIFFFLGLIGIIIAGERFAIILIFIFTSTYLFTITRLKNAIKNFAIIAMIIAFIISISAILYFFFKENYFIIFVSFFSQSDPSGSAQLHKILLFITLKIFSNYPLGIGIGKADFGAMNSIPMAFDNESFILTILLQGGLFSLFLYLIIHYFLMYKLVKVKAYNSLSFSIAVLISSIVNIQILQSITTTMVIAFIYLPSLIRRI